MTFKTISTEKFYCFLEDLVSFSSVWYRAYHFALSFFIDSSAGPGAPKLTQVYKESFPNLYQKLKPYNILLFGGMIADII